MAKTKPVLPLLEAGPVPLAQLRAAAKKQLVDIVDSKRGKKALILDPAISGSLQQLDSGLSELFTEHGIVKLLYLERTRLDDTTYNSSEPRLSDIRPIIYIARATLENAQLIAWQIKNSRVASSSSSRSAAASGAANVHEYSVFWVPRHSIAVQKVLEEEGVYGDVQQVRLQAGTQAVVLAYCHGSECCNGLYDAGGDGDVQQAAEGHASIVKVLIGCHCCTQRGIPVFQAYRHCHSCLLLLTVLLEELRPLPCRRGLWGSEEGAGMSV
eukprot:GHUV01011492.1.p1 GENE.GHUV01011492.1~~GHUV01011492.1.p1  ORF type:complete len:269 (+),score=64.31 GHUV01011492.1:290-1096(+)